MAWFGRSHLSARGRRAHNGRGRSRASRLISSRDAELRSASRRRMRELFSASVATESAGDRGRGHAARKQFADAADLGAHPAQLLLYMLIAAIDMVYAVDDGFSIGD
jgi:hypothetical protein